MMFFKDELNSELKLLLEDKRIAIVGPAHYLTGESQGNLIDDYDVVVVVDIPRLVPPPLARPLSTSS